MKWEKGKNIVLEDLRANTPCTDKKSKRKKKKGEKDKLGKPVCTQRLNKASRKWNLRGNKFATHTMLTLEKFDLTGKRSSRGRHKLVCLKNVVLSYMKIDCYAKLKMSLVHVNRK